jgi:hypothetical protein
VHLSLHVKAQKITSALGGQVERLKICRDRIISNNQNNHDADESKSIMILSDIMIDSINKNT